MPLVIFEPHNKACLPGVSHTEQKDKKKEDKTLIKQKKLFLVRNSFSLIIIKY